MALSHEHEALERIKRCAETHAGHLDLSRLGLTAIPQAIVELTGLRSLDLSFNRLSDLQVLQYLPNLQTLECSHNRLSDLQALQYVPKLQDLDCGYNQLSDLQPFYEPVMSGQLTALRLAGNPVQAIPPVILGERFDNCLSDLQHYWQALAHGAHTKRQLKVKLVGNGRVGKTTLAYALEHQQGPPAAFSSTHGISIRAIAHSVPSIDSPVTLQLWDFGGQEIYHATHRLFLADDCLYLLLWAEEIDEHPDETRHPVSYWLELIHDLAPASPIILVKNQIDRSDRHAARPAELADDALPGVQQIRQDVKVSAQFYQGINTLKGVISDVLEAWQHKVCLTLPSTWVQVEAQLSQLQQPTLSFQHFKQVCEAAGVPDARWLANYLHNTGVLFYQPGAFQDEIILDQNWAITAVYRLFDPAPYPTGCRALLTGMQGRFSGADTALFWPEHSETERQIYLSFMRQCGICYQPGRREYRDTPFAEQRFILPTLLPESSPAQAAWSPQASDWQFTIHYHFLHRSIIERLILRLDEAYQGSPWRNGIFCQTEYGQLLLAYDPHGPSTVPDKTPLKTIHCQLRATENPLDLLSALRRLVQEVSPHQRYKETLQKGSQATAEPLPTFKKEEGNARKNRLSLLDNPLPTHTLRLFISYSRADSAHKATLDKHLRIIKDTLQETVNLICWSDHLLAAGDGVNTQTMPELQRADVILLLLSPDFFDPERYSYQEELPVALKRHADECIPVIPIMLRANTRWQEKVGHLTVIPYAPEENARPLEDWPSADKYWMSVEHGIQQRIIQLIN